MKNLILPIALAVILLTACSKEEFVEQIEEQNIDSVYVLNQFNGAATWDTMLVDEMQRGTMHITAHTDGYYQPNTQNGMTITWSGTQFESGSSKGEAELKQTTPNFSFHFYLETECVTVQGNEAVYGGTITKVGKLSGNTPAIGIGWHFYFKVIDNGIGDSSAFDQIANKTIFASPLSPSLCDNLPDSHIWSSEGYEDVFLPGYVFVSTKE